MAAVLLDTHALPWWLTDDARLGAAASEKIATSQTFVSAASLWEIATKHRLGRLPEEDVLLRDAGRTLRREGFEPLSISHRHALLAGALDTPHPDPFDRMLIAQAMLDGLVLASSEERFDAIEHEGGPARRVW